MDGDFVVCEQTQVANAGDIVVALIGGEEATLKRFYREADRGKSGCSRRIRRWSRSSWQPTTLKIQGA